MRALVLLLTLLYSVSSYAFIIPQEGSREGDSSDLELSNGSDSSILTPPPPSSDLDLNSSEDLDVPPVDMGVEEDWVTSE